MLDAATFIEFPSRLAGEWLNGHGPTQSVPDPASDVAGGLYYLLTRNLDLDAERAAAEASRLELEGSAA